MMQKSIIKNHNNLHTQSYIQPSISIQNHNNLHTQSYIQPSISIQNHNNLHTQIYIQPSISIQNHNNLHAQSYIQIGLHKQRMNSGRSLQPTSPSFHVAMTRKYLHASIGMQIKFDLLLSAAN